MSTTSYSITVSPTDSPSTVYFTGVFVVRNSDNVVLNVYSTANPSTDLLIHNLAELEAYTPNRIGPLAFFDPTFVVSPTQYIFRAYIKNFDFTLDRTMYNYGSGENTISKFLLISDKMFSTNTYHYSFSTIPNPNDGSPPIPLNITQTISLYNGGGGGGGEHACYEKGTRILMSDSCEKLIEKIEVGDIVMTYAHGPKRVVRIGSELIQNNPKIWYRSLFRHKESGLTVTGGHSILVNSFNPVEQTIVDQFNYPVRQIDGMYTLLSTFAYSRFEQLQDNDIHVIYHFVVESDNAQRQYGVYANGILSETISLNDFNDSFGKKNVDGVVSIESEKISCA